MIEQFLNRDEIAVDTECTGLQFWKDKIFGFSVATMVEGKPVSMYVDIREEEGGLRMLKDIVSSCKRMVYQNAKFDCHMMREAGVIVDYKKIDDTMIAAALIDEHLLKYDLDYLGMKYVGVGKDNSLYGKLADIFGGKATKDGQMKNLHRAPSRIVSPYAAQDANTTLLLWQWQKQEIIKQELEKVYNLEMRLMPVLVRMEHGGVRINEGAAHHAMHEVQREIKKQQRVLNDLAGFEVNPNPSGSIKKLFEPTKNEDGVWVANDGTFLEKTDAGAPCLNKDALNRMKHPAAKLIIELRELVRVHDVFLQGHVLGHHHNGIVHANFNQTKSDNDLGTGTGRLSCNDPALQQIHKRNKKIAAIVRSVFIPDCPEHYWDCHDWKQMDFRVFADYTKDPHLLQMYLDDPDADYHGMVAQKTGLPRTATVGVKGNAKQINLGLVFGMGSGKLAAEMGLPFAWTSGKIGGEQRDWMVAGEEAQEVFRTYHTGLPSVKPLLDKTSSVAKSRGFVRTKMGRRIRFPGGKFTHKAGGLIFQGSAADALKLKMVEVDEMLIAERRTPDGGRLSINVHDELDGSLPRGGEGERLSNLITDVMCAFGPNDEITFNVPIRADCGKGDNWWEASK